MGGMSLIVKNITRLVAGFIALFGAYIVLYGHLTPGGVGGQFWVEFGPIWPILEAESGLALAPGGFEGRNVKIGKAESGAFFDFFSLFGRNLPPIGAF